MTRRSDRLLSAAAAALVVFGSDAAAAQQAPPGLSDIVVTAQRRPQSVQHVPGSGSGFPVRRMDDLGLLTPRQLAPLVPNMIAVPSPGPGAGNFWFIRGIGSEAMLATGDPAVGSLVDDVVLARATANNIGLFDTARTEVLRGPQNLLYGRNTAGGTVNVFLNRPSERVAGFGEAAYGAYGRLLLRGSIDLPFSPAVAIKLSGYHQDDDGYGRNKLTGERFNDSDLAGLRGAVQLTFSERVRWNLAYAYMRDDSENLLNFDCDPQDAADCGGRFASTGLVRDRPPGTASVFAGLGISGRKADFGLGSNSDSQLLTSHLEWEGAAVSLAAITGVGRLRQRSAIDYADGRAIADVSNPDPLVQGLATGGYTVLSDARFNQFSQELRASGSVLGDRIDYVAGLLYSREDSASDIADVAGSGAATLVADRVLRTESDARSGYLQAELKLGARLKLSGGVRYTDETRRLAVADNRAGCAGPACLTSANLAAAGTPAELRSRLWTPRLAASYTLGEGAMVYASAARGGHSGGWNGGALTPATLLAYDAETLWSYEAGARTLWFDKRLRLNLTGFWIAADDAQAASALALPGGFADQNGADFRNRGIELEVAAVPLPGLNLYASLGFQNARYGAGAALAPNANGVKSVRQQQIDCRAQLAAGRVPLAPGIDNAPDCAAGIIDANGNLIAPPRTPDFSAAFGAGWDFAIPAAGIIVTPSFNAQFSSAFETGSGTLFSGSTMGASGAVYPANPFDGDVISGSRTQSFVLVGAALTLRTDDDNWLLSIGCENCLDTEVSQSSRFNRSYLNPPRSWQIRAKREF